MELDHYDNVFALPDQLESVWKGIGKFDLQQMVPEGGIPVNVPVGTGNAGSVMNFSWTDNYAWWSPANSYFYFKFRFVKYSGTNQAVIPTYTGGNPNPDQFVTYCDNFVSTLFTKIVTYVNSQSIDSITQPWIVDQVLTYSNAKKNFLDTFGSLARVGEPLMKRILNVNGTGSGNGAVIEVAYRPPCSIYNTSLLPPGAQHRIEFTWAPSAIVAFESLIGAITVGTASGNYNIIVDDVKFYRATCIPSPEVPLPNQGVIELSQCSINQYSFSNAAQFTQAVTLAPTTNRVYLVFQDINQITPVTAYDTADTAPYADNSKSIKFMGVGTGWTPYTSFTKSFSYQTNATPPTNAICELGSLYIMIDELQLQLPKAQYNFKVDYSDWERAYMDWATLSVGTKYNDTGSVPFGFAISSNNATGGALFTALNTPGAKLTVFNGATPPAPAAIQQGNDANKNQIVLNYNKATPFGTTGTGFLANSYGFQTSEYGWLARSPGPIFAFNVCRPPGVKIGRGSIYATFNNGAPAGLQASFISCASNALAVTRNQAGLYEYTYVSST